jgi:hypothetical protein
MGALFSTSTQSSQSIFLVGKLNGKPLDEQRFYYLSQAYLDQPEERGDNLEKVSDEIPVSTSDKSKLESSQIFQPLPQKKKLFCLQTYVQWKSNLDLEFLKQFFTSPKRTIYK